MGGILVMKLKQTLWQFEEAGALLLAAIIAAASLIAGLFITYWMARAILGFLGVF